MSACGSASAPGRPLSLPDRVPRSRRSHVAVIVLENREASEVLGNPEAPYLNMLAHRWARASRYYGATHPSLPNYLALTGGSTFGITSDCTACTVSASNIVDQLEGAGISWRAYMEGMAHPCDLSTLEGEYAKKHDPFLYYRDIVEDPARCRKVVPYTQLGHALTTKRLPTFVWITPNLCDDGHNCGLSDVNRFLKGIVPALLQGIGPHGTIFITFDEGTSNRGCCGGQAGGGQVLTVAIGPDVRRGGVSSRPYDHYSLLATIESMLGLPRLRLAASPQTTTLRALFRNNRLPMLRALTRGRARHA